MEICPTSNRYMNTEDAMITYNKKLSKLKDNYYIHFIDVCIALSQLVVSASTSTEYKSLNCDLVNEYTSQDWRNNYDDEVINNLIYKLKKNEED